MNNSRLSMRSKTENFFDPREYVTQHANERDIVMWKEIFDLYDTD